MGGPMTSNRNQKPALPSQPADIGVDSEVLRSSWPAFPRAGEQMRSDLLNSAVRQAPAHSDVGLDEEVVRTSLATYPPVERMRSGFLNSDSITSRVLRSILSPLGVTWPVNPRSGEQP